MRFNGLYKYRKPIIIAAVVVIFLFCVFQVYSTLTFHETSTDPGVNNVATLSPFFKINFNKSLSSKNIKISYKGGAGDTYKVQGKTLTIYLNYPLSANTT